MPNITEQNDNTDPVAELEAMRERDRAELAAIRERGIARLSEVESEHQTTRSGLAALDAKHAAEVQALEAEFGALRAAKEREIAVRSAQATYAQTAEKYAAAAKQADALVNGIGDALKALADAYVEAVEAELERVNQGAGLSNLHDSLVERGLIDVGPPSIPSKRLAQGQNSAALDAARQVAVAVNPEAEKTLAALWSYQPRTVGYAMIMGQRVRVPS